MNERPAQPPEGKLLAEATENSGLSIREASRRAGISYGRWRQITTGVQHVSPGEFAAVHAPAKTLAKMAAVVGLTPEQMETEGQRPDAAEAMAKAVRQQKPEPPRRSSLPRPTEAMARDMALFSSVVEGCANTAMAAYPGQRLSGRQVFPDSPSAPAWWPAARAYWDAAAAQGVRLEDIPETVVTLLAWSTQLDRRERENGSATGLTHRPALVALR